MSGILKNADVTPIRFFIDLGSEKIAGPRTAVSYEPYVSLLRSIRACIYWYIGITKGTRRVVSVSATF